MNQANLDPSKLAVGAAIARRMDRQDRREQRHIQATRLSATSLAISIGFVAVSSIGMLILMMIMDR